MIVDFTEEMKEFLRERLRLEIKTRYGQMPYSADSTTIILKMDDEELSQVEFDLPTRD